MQMFITLNSNNSETELGPACFGNNIAIYSRSGLYIVAAFNSDEGFVYFNLIETYKPRTALSLF